ncbi:MAG: hypothetical protein K0R17_3174 [Rariglobus sp.]|jgi:hypothetical protein|nr:hypothetical protein [Rariglobus sp.]
MNIPTLLACFALLVPAVPLGAALPFMHLGPVETLDNGVVTLEVALKVGRIVAYHRKDEPNWLRVEDRAPPAGWNWNPWGGDRVWPTAQGLCPQIYGNNGFDPVIDGQPWEMIAKTETTLEMRSGVSRQLGLRITRRIELLPHSSTVEHTFLLERVAPSVFPVHAWTVTGLRAGDYVLMESDPRVPHPDWKPFKRWRGLSKEDAPPSAVLLPGTRNLHVSWPKSATIKLGTFGRWIALVSGDSALRQTIVYDPALLYLEESNLQAFLAPETSIYEIEVLSPTWTLREGEQQRWRVRWQLIDFPADVKTPGQRAAFLLDGVKKEADASLVR